MDTSKLILILLFQFFYLLTASGQEQKSNAAGIDFPCAPKVKLQQFEDKQTELNNLPPPIPPAVAPDFKKWQVVVDREFDYRAKPNNNGENWQWSVGDGSGTNFWNFIPSLNGTNKGVSKIIPDASLPMNNDFFGVTKGQLLVSAEVGKDDNNNPIVSSDQQEIKIFYKKDDMNYHDPNVPNWFYYWSQIIESKLTVGGIKVFDLNLGGFQTTPPVPIVFNLNYRDDGQFAWPQPPNSNIRYGENRAGNQLDQFPFYIFTDNTCINGYRRVITGYPNPPPIATDLFTIDIGKGCGYYKSIFDYGPGPGPGPSVINQIGTHRGIDCFYAVLIHELEHWLLLEDFWKDGYDSINDCDRDYYPDWWEISPIGAEYGFDPTIEDNYQAGYTHNNLPAFGPATHYQEERCRRKEIQCLGEIINGGTIHDFDWSFDPTYINQGKNW